MHILYNRQAQGGPVIKTTQSLHGPRGVGSRSPASISSTVQGRQAVRAAAASAPAVAAGVPATASSVSGGRSSTHARFSTTMFLEISSLPRRGMKRSMPGPAPVAPDNASDRGNESYFVRNTQQAHQDFDH